MTAHCQACGGRDCVYPKPKTINQKLAELPPERRGRIQGLLDEQLRAMNDDPDYLRAKIELLEDEIAALRAIVDASDGDES